MKKTIQRMLTLAAFLTFSIGAHAQQRVWQNDVKDAETWQQLSKPERDAEFSKFVLDVKTGKMYFFDAHVFNLHIDFGLEVLLKQSRSYENIKSFNRNYSTQKPQFILGYLTHYPKLDLWTFSFWEGDTITARDVTRTYKALNNTFFIPKLTYRPDSFMQEQMAKNLRGIKVITNDKIYANLPFQAFQTGSATGKLRIIPAGTALDKLDFASTDIVLLQEAYPDINPVAGIITTQFSTPLAHVNLRASAWGIPNASDKTAAQRYAALNGQIVHYEVTEQNLNLRTATDAERLAFEQQAVETRSVTLPQAKLTDTRLQSLSTIKARDVLIYGTKTANLGEIASAKQSLVNVPTGFGVPFYYYAEHIRQNHLQANIDAVLDDARFTTDAAWRREQLETLRKAITDAPMNADHFAAIEKQWQSQLGGKGAFVRSSTNAEDLKGFNGAGLYDTVPNVATRSALDAAIKKVWASVWNERAVTERQFAGINQRAVYPAVMIQTG
ncbi:MAG: PEP/pyruvate-binding domain-containing protein, partial [Formosimonas sp.]